MFRISHALSALVVGLVSVPLVFMSASPAAADTNCGSSNTGWFPYDVRSRVVIVNQYQSSERAVKLNLTNDQVSDHSYSSFSYGYKSGDQTWVDRSYDGGSTWTQCGPFTRNYSNTLKNVGNWMRACFRPVDYPQSYCTTWYYDND
ncbi:hypothetical protein GCM10009677_09310 [Sphaerisporangium rubeum]|uniref:Secreted protein n=1 Tax=Sphaerisporangium rubeum TaxID=321317 RepID=A0A7X0IMP9_9ACTN|nr:hypothetical protein [Sphaerisporangium rubeum]MBB6476562.1 hypothetical protein [Sphaerisporangium rubeum]